MSIMPTREPIEPKPYVTCPACGAKCGNLAGYEQHKLLGLCTGQPTAQAGEASVMKWAVVDIDEQAVESPFLDTEAEALQWQQDNTENPSHYRVELLNPAEVIDPDYNPADDLPAPPTPSAGEARYDPNYKRCGTCGEDFDTHTALLDHARSAHPASPQLPTPELEAEQQIINDLQHSLKLMPSSQRELFAAEVAGYLAQRLALQAKAADERFEAAITDNDLIDDEIGRLRERWYEGGTR